MVLNKLIQVHGTVEQHIGEIPGQDGICTVVLCPGESFSWDLGAVLLSKGRG